MRRMLATLSVLLLAACSSQVSDLDELRVDGDACDPTGRTARGTDLDLQFIDVTPHVNQDIFFAVTVMVRQERSIEAMMVLSTLADPDMNLVVPKLLPEGASELAFWADSMPAGFDPINEDGSPNDHQWTRPVCPNGQVTFTHTTPFQSVQNAVSTGAIFSFLIPEELQRPELFDTFTMWVTAMQLSDEFDEVQARAYYRWSPLVAPARGIDVPEQRDPPVKFQVGGNALGEPRGAIDTLSFYEIEFVIDVDESGDKTGGDYVCTFRDQAPDAMTWMFEFPRDDDGVLDLGQCDAPADFDPLIFEP